MRAFPSSTDVPVLLLNQPINNIATNLIIIIIVIGRLKKSSQLLIRHLQLAQFWLVHRMSSSEKCVLSQSILDLVRKGILQSPWCSFPMGGLKQCIDVGRFILLHAQNVTKELVMCYPKGLQAVPSDQKWL